MVIVSIQSSWFDSIMSIHKQDQLNACPFILLPLIRLSLHIQNNDHGMIMTDIVCNAML